MHLAMNISKIAFASLAVGAIILLSASISEKDAGTYAKRALIKTVARASKISTISRLQNTKVNCGFVYKVLKEMRNCYYYPPKRYDGANRVDCLLIALTQNKVLKDCRAGPMKPLMTKPLLPCIWDLKSLLFQSLK